MQGKGMVRFRIGKAEYSETWQRYCLVKLGKGKVQQSEALASHCGAKVRCRTVMKCAGMAEKRNCNDR